MNQILKKIYVIIFLLSSIVYVSKIDFTFTSYKDNKYMEIKYFLVWIATIFISYSLYYTNEIVNKYILPILLVLNVAILLLISYYYDKFSNKFHYISVIGIIILLISFKIESFKINMGYLENVDETWIYSYIIVIILWFVTSSYLSNTAKLLNILLILYPLLYPLNEYFIHRVYILVGTKYIYEMILLDI